MVIDSTYGCTYSWWASIRFDRGPKVVQIHGGFVCLPFISVLIYLNTKKICGRSWNSLRHLVLMQDTLKNDCMLHQQGSVLRHTSLNCYSCLENSAVSVYLSIYLVIFAVSRDQWLHRQNMWIVIFFPLWPGLCSSVSCSQGALERPYSVLRGKQADHVQFCWFFPSKSTFLTCRNRCSVITAKPVLIFFLRASNRPPSTFLPFSSECSYFLTCVGC